MTKIIRPAVAVLLLCSVLSFVSCEKRQEGEPSEGFPSVSLGYQDWSPEEGERILVLVDSLERTEAIQPVRADFNRGMAHHMMNRYHVAEMYYRRAYERCEPDHCGWENFYTMASRLSSVRMVSGDYEGALSVATQTFERFDQAGELTDERKVLLLWNVSQCDLGLGMIEEWERVSAQVYDYLREEVRKNGAKTSNNLLIFTTMIANDYIARLEMDKAALWLDRCEEELRLYAEAPLSAELLEDYTWRVALARVNVLHANGDGARASKLFAETLPLLMDSSQGLIEGALYLMRVRRNAEAADLFDRLETLPSDENPMQTLNLLSLCRRVIPQLYVNLEAGRTGKVMELSRRLCLSLGDAIDGMMRSNAAELATLYAMHQRDEQIAEQKAKLTRVQLGWVSVLMTVLTVFLAVFNHLHRRHLKTLEQEHRKLETAYSDLAQANLRAEESSRMKSHFIQQISHEIRTPLNILSGFSQVMMSSGMTLGEEERAEINKGILDNTDRITSLVNKMLGLSDAVSQGDVPQDDATTVAQIAQAAVAESGIQEAAHLCFSVVEKDHVGSSVLHTNLTQASYALSMLLENARKFTQTPSGQRGMDCKESVTLVLSHGDGAVLFAVEDTGIGVPQPEMEHIFEEFVQLDDYYTGTGIGLTVARALARRLGGDVYLDSNYTGGARFVFSLPL
ncbi:MAG: HAMP domain-containing histidine kinase [Bacteroidales bacterium]|nr:HAMP domain-containing histidine kinase [Bacteroidales bacterium]